MQDMQSTINGISVQNLETYTEFAISYGVKILGALAVFVFGRWVAQFLKRLLRSALEKAQIDETLSLFLGNISYAALLTFVVISSLGTLGVNTTSFAAIVAAAGLAIGLALQSSLSNFASGVMIIAFKFFTKGDYVEIAGTAGTVEEVKIFTTLLRSPDNKSIIIPNGTITSRNIVNYSTKPQRRVDMVFGISYDDDIKLAKETLLRIFAENEKVLKEPVCLVAVKELADSSINFVCKPWVNSEDYWDVYYQTQEQVKLEFDKVGLTIPYPQRDVHLHQSNKNV